MYGGTGGGRLPSVVVALAILGGLAACQQDEVGRTVESASEATSGSPGDGTPSADAPRQMRPILVAAAPISAGESLADAKMTGRFELQFVPTDEVLPGAVSSTKRIGGVALEDLAVGEQITEDSFGSP